MKRLIATIVATSLLLSSSPAFCEDVTPPAPTPPAPLTLNLDLRVAPLTLGQEAPFSGVLLTTDAMTKMQYDHSLELSLLKSQHDFSLQTLQLQFDAEQSLRQTERSLHETILSSRLERIQNLEELAIAKRPDWVLPVAILGSFVVGAAVTVGITYAVNQP